MGILVSAAEAGALVGRHERMVRWHIQRGDLPAKKTPQGRWQVNTDDLTRIPGWQVDRERLARLELRQSRTYSGLVARVEAMEARVRALEASLRALDALLRERAARNHPPQPVDEPKEPKEPDDDDGEPDTPENTLAAMAGWSRRVAETPQMYADGYRGPSTVTLVDRGPQTPLGLRSRADAGRWLERHGINSALTPKTWPGWRHVELTPRGVLTFALARQAQAAQQGDWRVGWRLHHCADATCVCRELLPEGPGEPDGAA